MNFTSTNETSAGQLKVQCEILDSSVSKLIQILANVVVLAAALSGNLLVLVNYYRSKLQTSVDALIANMAVSDILVALLIVSRALNSQISTSNTWEIDGGFGDAMCRFLMFAGDVVSIVTITSLCIITIERFVMVNFVQNSHGGIYSLRQTRNKWLNPCLIGLSWIIPIIYDFHFFLTFRTVEIRSKNATFCGGPFFESRQSYYIYNTFTCLVVIIIPFLILSTLNAAVVIKLRRLYTSLMHFREDQNASGNLEHLEKQRHIKNMMIGIVTAFGICWGPYFIMAILYTFYWELQTPRTCSFYTFSYVAVFMTRAHAALNPWIYVSFRKEKKIRFFTSLTLALRRISNHIIPDVGSSKHNGAI